MAALRVVLGDQLSRSIASLSDLDLDADRVLMVEVAEETTYVPHHKKKIAFILSAMRHFAEDLREEGVAVDYVTLDDPGNTGSFTGEVRRAALRHNPDRIVVTEPGEYRVLKAIETWRHETGVDVTIRRDDRFLSSIDEFADWAEGRKALRMEYFYREMRKQTGILMTDGKPVGGLWNFDQDNRERLPDDVEAPQRLMFESDDITREVLDLVETRFGDHFGDLEPFWLAVTRDQALQALDHFIEDCLPEFGRYQDAMREGAPLLFHSVLSPYLNTGLLLPGEICAAAEEAYRDGRVPLNAAEGFIRQILGWREYVRGLYWLKMPAYKGTNTFGASRPLPEFYWTAETDMNCLRQAVSETRANAYAHHIQRLMVTGNFALLAGLDPEEVNAWYMIVYADAFEWVELPNTHGMALFADGGVMASKPYAASGAYIDRMSDYCRSCRFDVNKKAGPDACPFNYLYWDFLIRNSDLLRGNPRLGMIYKTLDRMEEDRRKEIRVDAAQFLTGLC